MPERLISPEMSRTSVSEMRIASGRVGSASRRNAFSTGCRLGGEPLGAGPGRLEDVPGDGLGVRRVWHAAYRRVRGLHFQIVRARLDSDYHL